MLETQPQVFIVTLNMFRVGEPRDCFLERRKQFDMGGGRKKDVIQTSTLKKNDNELCWNPSFLLKRLLQLF